MIVTAMTGLEIDSIVKIRAVNYGRYGNAGAALPRPAFPFLKRIFGAACITPVTFRHQVTKLRVAPRKTTDALLGSIDHVSI
jgi:hypothetical protein